MNDVVDYISKVLKDDLENYELVLKSSLHSNVKLINLVVSYSIKHRGKRFRPMLCLLCSRLNNETPNKFTYLSASTVEILHVATLLHDDVVDEASLRRGWPSIKKIWNNKIAILVGDYMFSKSLKNISELDDLESIKLLSKISHRLSEGEILQIEKAKNRNMTEEVYFKMISDKTASLISGSCVLGYLSKNNDSRRKNIENFGEFLGIAYQMKDDLFDIVGKLDEIGKHSNLDLKKNMLTLPYIYTINNSSKEESINIINKIKYLYNKNDLKQIKKIIINSGGIDYTNHMIEKYSNKAIKELNVFNDSEYKDLLIDLVNFNMDRIK